MLAIPVSKRICHPLLPWTPWFFCFAGAYVLFDSLANWAYLEPITCTVRDAIGGAFAEPDPGSNNWRFWWSCYWLIPLAFFFVAVFPIGAAHWLTSGSRKSTQGKGMAAWFYHNETLIIILLYGVIVGFSVLAVLAASHLREPGLPLVGVGQVIFLIALLSFVFFLFARVRVWFRNRGLVGAFRWRVATRNVLAGWLGVFVAIFVASVAFALVDSLAQKCLPLLSYKRLAPTGSDRCGRRPDRIGDGRAEALCARA